MASLQEILKFNDEQLTSFTSDFEERLPKYLRNAFHPENTPKQFRKNLHRYIGL